MKQISTHRTHRCPWSKELLEDVSDLFWRAKYSTFSADLLNPLTRVRQELAVQAEELPLKGEAATLLAGLGHLGNDQLQDTSKT